MAEKMEERRQGTVTHSGLVRRITRMKTISEFFFKEHSGEYVMEAETPSVPALNNCVTHAVAFCSGETRTEPV